jgi:tellurite resistance protein
MSPNHTVPIIPASFFGMPLGLLALGLAWRGAAALWDLPHSIADVLLGAGFLLWAFLLIQYLRKWVGQRAIALAEFDHPVQCCFVGLGGVDGLLASIGWAPYSRTAALGLLVIGATWVVVFGLYRTGCLWQGERAPETTTAVLYLPTVSGALVSASAAATLGWQDWGQLAFGAGVLSWLAIESVLVHRLYTAAPLAPALRPTLGIQLAPPAVAAVAYLNVGGGAPDLIAHALVGYALLQALILIRLWPWLKAAGQTPAWWGFSFGAAALPTAAIKLVARGDTGAVETLAPYLFIAGNLVIATVAVMTVRLALRGQLFGTASTRASLTSAPTASP